MSITPPFPLRTGAAHATTLPPVHHAHVPATIQASAPASIKLQKESVRDIGAVRTGLASPIDIAINRATRLMPHEIATIVGDLRDAARGTIQGLGTRHHWLVLCHALNVALAVEHFGVVKGFADELARAKKALEAIGTRAGEDDAPPTWSPPALTYAERGAVWQLVSAHAFQIDHLAFGEYHQAVQYALARCTSSGGEVVKAC